MMVTATRPTVLIVDDEPEIRELARIFLELDGFEVVGEASDGAQAVQRFIDLDPPPVPTVVLLDNRMPVLTGLQAAELILDHNPHQLIVIFSAFMDDATEARARSLGIAACVSKTDAAELPGIVRALLER